MCDGCSRDRVRQAICEADRITDVLYRLIKRKDISEEQREVLIDAMNRAEWDDAIHVAAPWEPRSSLCGQWGRNLVALDEQMPNGMAGCWTCLLAAEWFNKQKAAEPEPERALVGATA